MCFLGPTDQGSPAVKHLKKDTHSRKPTLTLKNDGFQYEFPFPVAYFQVPC